MGQALAKGNRLMKPLPPPSVEAAVGLLIPPACREEVLGDLHERYASLRQYILDVIRAVPFVILSRIRRTTDPAVLLMEALAVYLSFLIAAWYVDRTLLSDPAGLWRLAIPVIVTLFALILRDAYATPGVLLPWECVLRPVLGAGCALSVSISQSAVPFWIVVWGSALSILLVSPLRLVFPPVALLPRGAGGPPFWHRYADGPSGSFCARRRAPGRRRRDCRHGGSPHPPAANEAGGACLLRCDGSAVLGFPLA